MSRGAAMKLPPKHTSAVWIAAVLLAVAVHVEAAPAETAHAAEAAQTPAAPQATPASVPTAAPATAAPASAAPGSARTSEGVLLATHSATGVVAVRSWKTLRDARIVKQDLDDSCGAASLATLLNEFYGQNLTEEALLRAMDQGDGMASFEDMARALPQFGFRAQGFAANWEQLVRLRMPVIVYLEHRRTQHFSVIRGIDADAVWLADPSLGNRTFSRAQFLAMWQTRGDAAEHAGLRGRFLAVLPARPDVQASDGFFTRSPVRQSAPAVGQLAVRALP
jgi:predicted double-glycine peptidase